MLIKTIPVHCNDRNEEKHRPEYHSLHRKGPIRNQKVIFFLFYSYCCRTPHNSLSIKRSVLCSHRQHRHGNCSMYVRRMTENKTASQKDGIIQEMPYVKFPALPLQPPVLIQMERFRPKNYPKTENNLWRLIYRNTEV